MPRSFSRRAQVRLDVLTEDMPARPRVREDCPPHPCPWLGCRHHLALDITAAGSIRLTHAEGVAEFPEAVEAALEALSTADYSCALDVAEQGGHSLERVGVLLGLTRERVRQIEDHIREQILDGGMLDEHRESESVSGS